MFFVYVLRFHRYSGNVSLIRSIKELLDYDSWPKNPLFLKCTTERLKRLKITREVLLEEHTASSFYRIFIPRNEYKRLEMKIMEQPHLISNALPNRKVWEKEKTNALWYCPVCHSYSKEYSNIAIYQQIPGVHICHKHGCYLKKIPLSNKEALAHPEGWDLACEFSHDEWLHGISEDVHWILEAKPEISLEDIPEAIWNKITEVYPNETMVDIEEIIKVKLSNLPEEYKLYFYDFKLAGIVATPYNKSVSILEYLIVVRLFFGNFNSFYEYLKEYRENLCLR